MFFDCYLAMTAWEMEKTEKLPPKCAWMACHFSPYGTGLSNLPTSLPHKSIIILNDRTPIYRHDPILIADQLTTLCHEFGAEAVLLDFQRPFSKEYEAVVMQVVKTLSVPVGVTEAYAEKNPCAVFLPPPPLHYKPTEYFKKWHGRDIWLEAALESELVKITASEVMITSAPHPDNMDDFIADDDLMCHYRTQISDDHITFSLSRSYDDLVKTAEFASQMGVTKIIGLYQELGNA